MNAIPEMSVLDALSHFALVCPTLSWFGWVRTRVSVLTWFAPPCQDMSYFVRLVRLVRFVGHLRNSGGSTGTNFCVKKEG